MTVCGSQHWRWSKGIRYGAKAWKLSQERFKSVETLRVVTLVAQLVRLQDSEDLDSFIISTEALGTNWFTGGAGSMTPRRDPRKETAFCVGSLVTFPRTARGRSQHNAASVVRRVTSTGHERDKEMVANMSQWQPVQHWQQQTRKTVSSYPVEDSRHASG